MLQVHIAPPVTRRLTVARMVNVTGATWLIHLLHLGGSMELLRGEQQASPMVLFQNSPDIDTKITVCFVLSPPKWMRRNLFFFYIYITFIKAVRHSNDCSRQLDACRFGLIPFTGFLVVVFTLYTSKKKMISHFTIKTQHNAKYYSFFSILILRLTHFLEQ